MKTLLRFGGLVICIAVLAAGVRFVPVLLKKLSSPRPSLPVRSEHSWRIIEGWTIEDEAKLLGATSSTFALSLTKLVGRSVNRAPFDLTLRAEFAFLRALPHDRSLEGYLFPETYRVWDDQLPEGLVRKQLQTFRDRVALTSVKIPAPLKTLDEVVILASIIEKEVRSDTDRGLVAGIFLRRLKEGMALQSDATLTYLTGSSRGRATSAELAQDSPYNSYRRVGLPPSPICNPGLATIGAVMHPTPSAYRYFLTDPTGKVLYARTFEEHLKNKRQAGY